jgi:hypothetical protein
MNVNPLASARDSSRSSRAKDGKSLIKKTFGLAAFGVMVALAAGCSSGSSGSSAASPRVTAPAWAKSLGSGVTVTGSSTAKAGDGSPAGVGDKALVGSTGAVCEAGSCSTNTNPAALFDSGKSFSTLWQAPANGSNSSAYALIPLIRVNGTWYLYTTSV